MKTCQVLCISLVQFFYKIEECAFGEFSLTASFLSRIHNQIKPFDLEELYHV